MNSHEVRRRALLAVAKLSVFAGATGCGGVVVMPDEKHAYEAKPEASNDVVPYDVPIYKRPPSEATATCFGPDTDAAACCDQALTQAFADDHLFGDPTLATDDEQACCDLVFDAFVTWDGAAEPPFDWAHQSNCCVLDPGAALCSPWGPPMPPAMPRLEDRRGAVA